MKLLFIAGGSAPTIFALAPLATAARNAGHQVLMAATADVMDTITASGLPAIACTDRDIRYFIHTDRDGGRLEIPEDPVEQLLFTGRWFSRMALASLPVLRELARDWRPDLIVGGTMSYAAPLMAAELGLPWVRQLWDISDPTLMDEGANAELRPELAALGLGALPAAAEWIDICPPSIQRPDAHPARLMRWVPANRQRQLEPWMYTRGRRRVCVTSGHRVAHDQNFEFLRGLAKTVAELDMEMIVAAPEEVARELRGELPEVRTDWFPLDVVLPTCDVVVNHAGGQTVLTALNAGIPQLQLPARDAKSIAPALRIAAYGAGITLLGHEETPEKIHEACIELAVDPSYGAAAVELSDEMATLPPAAEVVGLLEETST